MSPLVSAGIGSLTTSVSSSATSDAKEPKSVATKATKPYVPWKPEHMSKFYHNLAKLRNNKDFKASDKNKFYELVHTYAFSYLYHCTHALLIILNESPSHEYRLAFHTTTVGVEVRTRAR